MLPQATIVRTMMAGHNKWSKIRHKKGANDRKKALALGKASKSLTIVSKECKGDRSDPRLQSAIQHAKMVKLPKDRIDDAIHKGTITKGAAGGGGEFRSLRFDAMMRIGVDDSLKNTKTNNSVQVACIITALSDNRNRATQNIRHLVNKHGGEFLPTDHLNYLFEKVGHIEVEPLNQDELESGEEWEDKLFECALEAGATNVEPLSEEEDNGLPATDSHPHSDAIAMPRFLVTTAESDLWKVARALRPDNHNGSVSDNDDSPSEAGFAIMSCEHHYVPREEYGKGTAEVASIRSDSEAYEHLDKFLDCLDEDEDVHKVYHNAVLE